MYEELGYTDCSEIKDRNYFHSIYCRCPGGILVECAATAQGGFAKDEAFNQLGTHLLLPPWFEPRRAEIEAMLDPIRIPETVPAYNRGELIAALLTLPRSWYANGCPEHGGPRLGSFVDWSRILGNVLADAGLPDFLANKDDLYNHNDADGGQWEAFFEGCGKRGSQGTNASCSDAVNLMDKPDLADDITLREPAHLAFPDHVRGLISRNPIQRSAHRSKPKAGGEVLNTAPYAARLKE